MAINYPNFLNAPIQESPFKNIIEDVFKGYSMSQIPSKLADEKKQREFANQLKAMEVEHKPKEYELNDQGKRLANALHSKALEHYEEKFGLERDLKKAQIQRALQTKLGGNVKANGELANFIVSHPDASQEDIRKAYDQIHGQKMEHEQTIINRSKDVVAGNSFDKLPTNDKKREVGLMTAMGVDPIEATSLLRKGISPTQYAKDNNIDISKVTPQYPLGEQNVKDLQRTSSYFDEMNSLEKNISDGLGGYQNKIMGYSLEQVADALAGDNPDKQGRALAARALLPELSALRLKIAGGNVGIEALRELEEKSLGQLNIIESLVDTPTYLAAQKYMKSWIEDAGRRRVQSLQSFGKLRSKASSSMGSDPLGLR